MEHLRKICGRRHIPIREILIKCDRIVEHLIYISKSCSIPITDILIERTGVFEKVIRRG